MALSLRQHLKNYQVLLGASDANFRLEKCIDLSGETFAENRVVATDFEALQHSCPLLEVLRLKSCGLVEIESPATSDSTLQVFLKLY